MTLPTFIVIGAGKAGTTSIYHYLAQHPDVHMSRVKETCYFAYDDAAQQLTKTHPQTAEYYRVKTLAEYRSLFTDTGGAKAVGEVSPQYIYTHTAPPRMRQLLGDVRIIAVLRNPVERAFSSYCMYRDQGKETRSFEQAIDDEIRGVGQELPWGWHHYLDRGRYARMLQPYYLAFGSDRVHIELFEDFQADAPEVMRRIYRFIGVDQSFCPDLSTQYNATGRPRNRLVHMLTHKRQWTTVLKNQLPKWVREPLYKCVMKARRANLERIAVPDHTRVRLESWFADDVRQLEKMLLRNLSHWSPRRDESTMVGAATAYPLNANTAMTTNAGPATIESGTVEKIMG